jgi:cytosine/adenosine deaminase-related metal-dependent hydrolase
MCADFFAVDVREPAFAGALHDPVAAVVLCAPAAAAYTYVQGRPVVREGRLVTLDLPRVVERHNRLARAMLEPA